MANGKQQVANYRCFAKLHQKNTLTLDNFKTNQHGQPGTKYIIMLRDDIGKRIAELRKKRKLSQVDLALKTGLDKGHIARIELGRYSVGIDTLQKIADALNVKIELIE